jgi:hypothetical protein
MTTNTLEKRAFKELLFEKFPRINKNCIEDFMKVNKLFTMKDFLNKYEVLNNVTISQLHNDILEYMFS